MGKSGMTLKASAEVVRGPRGLSIKELKYKETLANGNNIYEVILENNVVIGEIESKKGDKGIQGIKGDTGRGIFSLLKKGKQGPETTYEFTYTDGTTDIFIVEDGENAYEIATDNGFEGTEEEWLLSLIGPQGKSLEFNWNGTELGIRVEGETAYNYVNLKGEKGETGPRGIQGPKGEKGDKGDVGPAGAQGIQGVAGPKGDKGDIGATGPKGDKGPAGPQGIQGLQGVAGPKGEKGDKGEQGIQGPKGEKGDIGPKGDTTAITYGTTAGTVMEGSKLAEILGIPYGGSLNTTTSKVVGTAYYDNTTKKTYKCTVANSLNYADSTKFEAISNNDLLAKLQNLSNWESGSNSNGFWFKEKIIGLKIAYRRGIAIGQDSTITITLPIIFTTTNYIVNAQAEHLRNDSWGNNLGINIINTSSFKIHSSGTQSPFSFVAIGY
ncbi:collagen-like protein [Fusobacterium ulcerans]|uniref:collagen-like protein n=1 Tax=Fusobacterium ulcerans TaxID=861 RepID=UPI0010306CD3|nr:collagen-like protein [Fusobacterium ulcerans]